MNPDSVRKVSSTRQNLYNDKSYYNQVYKHSYGRLGRPNTIGMKNGLEIYLRKYKNIKPPDDVVREAVINAVKEEVGVKIEKRHVKVIRENVVIDTASHLKNTIFIKKKLILKRTKRKLGKNTPKEII